MSQYKHSEINWSKFVALSLRLVGKKYVFGAEVDVRNPDPDRIQAIDCSELVEWLYAQIGITVPDGSYNQDKVCREVPKDKLLIGDLGFKWNPDTHVIHHVGVYIGDDRVIEAKGHLWGVVTTLKSSYEMSRHFAKWGRLKCVLDA